MRNPIAWRSIVIGLLALASTAMARDRDPNATLNLPSVPGSQGYTFVAAFPGVTFNVPVAIASPPKETNRLFVVEEPGRISVITNLALPNRTTFLDLTGNTVYGGEQGLLGLALHPEYAKNGRFFIYRTVNASTGGGAVQNHDRLSEFHVSAANPNVADPSEKILFQQADLAGNHNGGDVHFGPDGYLYVSLGDEGGQNDQFKNGQKIDHDFFSAILRLDVDARPGSLAPNPHAAIAASPGAYRVPADNPYVGATTFNGHSVNPAAVRTEFWSVGWRNPWRMSFDPATGELWVGHVGQDTWESVAVTGRGANHGWSYIEATSAGPYGAPAGFLTDPKYGFVPPVYSYRHGSEAYQGNSVIGGVVYRGTRIAALVGAYIFSDYVSANVWTLRRDATGHATVVRIANSPNISAYGTDPRNGDVLAAHLGGNRLLRLDYTGAFTGAPIPPTLADTGAFADVAALQPVAAMEPYDVALPFWSDGALKSRWFFVPGTNRVGVVADGAWKSPIGTVWMKHFEMEMTVGDPASRRRLETRFLVNGSNGLYGVTYRWNSATNAELVPDAGADEVLEIQDGATIRSQTWHYPGRGECLACHTPVAGGSLGFTTAQLNRPDAATGSSQIARIAAAGYLSGVPPALSPLASLVSGPAPDGTPASLESRARNYLAANCSQCHRPGGTAPAFWDARDSTPTDLADIISGKLNDSRGDLANRVVVPGDIAHSVLYQRMSMRGPGQMPPLATSVPDTAGAQLLHDWIVSLADRVSFADWAKAQLGDSSGNPPPSRDSDGDGAVDLLEYLAGTDPKDSSKFWSVVMDHAAGNAVVRLHMNQPAGVAYRIEVTTVPGGAWTPLDVVANAPFYPAVSRDISLEIPATDETRLFRVGLMGR